MKGFLKWFKSGAKMKRWMLVILAGIVLLCFSIAEIMAIKEMSFMEVAKIIILFTIGFTFVILGLIYSQKRVLEILIEDTDSRIEKGKNDVNVKSLIFNKTVYDEGPNIVAIGGGNGLNTVLKGLKNYTNNLTAIVTVSDYGNIPTSARRELELLPVEDIKESIIALSNEEDCVNALFNTQFDKGRLEGLLFGDIFMSAMNKTEGDFVHSIENISKILNMTGKVLPVTLDEVTICAELDDGTVVEQKEKIPEIVYEKISKINRIYLNPNNCKPAPGVLEAIQHADAIILGPGSLYTNVIPNLLVKNVAKTIKESKAIKIYVSNIMTEPGQTDDYSLSDHINAITEHVGDNLIDYCIYDTGEIIPEYIKKYNEQGSDIVEQDITRLRAKGIKLLQRKLSNIVDGSIRHDPDSVAESIIGLICDDLKFRDESHNPEYVMLKSRLKEGKKKTKPLKKQKQEQTRLQNKEKKEAGKHIGRKSKFQTKYKDRIISIKTSEEKRQARLKSLNANTTKSKDKGKNKKATK